MATAALAYTLISPMKKKPIDEKTPNDWLAVLTAASRGTPDVVPHGFQTLAKITGDTGRSETQIRREMRLAISAGLVETAKFNVDTGTKLYPVTHYRIK